MVISTLIYVRRIQSYHPVAHYRRYAGQVLSIHMVVVSAWLTLLTK